VSFGGKNATLIGGYHAATPAHVDSDGRDYKTSICSGIATKLAAVLFTWGFICYKRAMHRKVMTKKKTDDKNVK